mgnify:FL=1
MLSDITLTYDQQCRRCPRLAGFLDEVKLDHPDYFCRPVPPFGDAQARLLIVGLAPGMHGANRSGRPFTGDYAGILLYQTLHKFGFASLPVSTSADDSLRLHGCRISNAVKCLPPQNKPETSEIKCCNPFLANELAQMPAGSIVLALGNIAHQAVLMARGVKRSAYTFAHAARHQLPGGITLFDSYHCSRYNTQTRRLTADMFESVFAQIRQELDGLR